MGVYFPKFFVYLDRVTTLRIFQVGHIIQKMANCWQHRIFGLTKDPRPTLNIVVTSSIQFSNFSLNIFLTSRWMRQIHLISDGSVIRFWFFDFGNLIEKWVECKFSELIFLHFSPAVMFWAIFDDFSKWRALLNLFISTHYSMEFHGTEKPNSLNRSTTTPDHVQQKD